MSQKCIFNDCNYCNKYTALNLTQLQLIVEIQWHIGIGVVGNVHSLTCVYQSVDSLGGSTPYPWPAPLVLLHPIGVVIIASGTSGGIEVHQGHLLCVLVTSLNLGRSFG